MHDDIKRAAVRGVGWAFLSSTSVRALQVITTLTLAKLLTPSDFGLFALASIITNAMAMLPDLGFAQALIYEQGDIKKSANTAFILSTATGSVLAIALFALAPMIARAFDTPGITAPIRVMSVTLAITGATAVPMSLFDKGLKFQVRAIPEIAGALTYAALSIGLAAAKFGAWSMVAGWTAMVAVSAIATWIVSPWRPQIEFCPEKSRVIVNYGKHLVIATLAAFIFLQIDKAAIGKWMGVRVLGFYSIAFTVCNLPATNLTAVVNRVMFPTYSKLSGDLPEIARVYLGTIRHISSVAFPAAVTLMLLPGPVVRVFYGPKWEGAIPLFAILAIYGLVRAIGATSESVFMAIGQPNLVRRISITQLVLGTALVYPIVKAFGAEGVAVLFTCAYLAGTLYGIAKVRKILKVGLIDWMKAMRAPAIAAGASWVVTTLVGARPTWGGIAITSTALFGSYAIFIYLLDRSAYADVLAMLRRRRSVV